MKKDFEILEIILTDLHYTKSYIDILLNHLATEFENSNLPGLTPQFIYTHLIFEEGRERAKTISEYFEEFKEKGSYTPISHRSKWA